MAELHIGEMIRHRIQQRGISVKWFAARLCCERTNVYSIYRRRSIDTALLIRICRILEYDFFRDISRLTLPQDSPLSPGASPDGPSGGGVDYKSTQC